MHEVVFKKKKTIKIKGRDKRIFANAVKETKIT